jgi:predicted Zn-dependent peptidase
VVPGALHSPAEVRAVAGSPWAGAAQTARLANGLTVIALHRAGFPFVSAVLGFRSVPSPDAPPGLDVAARFGRRYWNLGTPLRHDMVAQAVTGHDNTRDEIRAYASDAGHAITHLADKVRGLTWRWPDTQFDRWAAETMVIERQPESEAARSFAAALWGHHVYGLYTPVERVRQRSQAEIAAWVNRTERPENGALVIVGDVDPAEVMKRAEHELASAWRQRPAPTGGPVGAPPVALNPRAPAAAMPVLFTRQPERRSAILHFGCLLPPVRGPRERAVNALLAQLLRDDLFERVRSREGKSYAPSVTWQHLWGGAASLEGSFDIERAAADQGVRALHDLLDQGGGSLFDPARIDRARWRLAVEGAEWQETNLIMARHLFAAWKNGWPLSALDHYGDDLAEVTPGELQAALGACRASAVVSVLGPAAPSPIPPPPPAAGSGAAAAVP